MLDTGFSCVEVGRILFLDDDTVRGYRNVYCGLNFYRASYFFVKRAFATVIPCKADVGKKRI
ncbi:MAG: hypothetical protein L3J08_00925 [Flavobacteriaceae bacterium]|nr:hypothetical protein [Flavobacteriaceae bacterium]